jgi:hypothetical protein
MDAGSGLKSPFEILGLSPLLVTQLQDEQLVEVARIMARSLHLAYHPDGASGDAQKFREVSEAIAALKMEKLDGLRAHYASEGPGQSERAEKRQEFEQALNHYNALVRLWNRNMGDPSKKEYQPKRESALTVWSASLYSEGSTAGKHYYHLCEAPGTSIEIKDVATVAEIKEKTGELDRISRLIASHMPEGTRLRMDPELRKKIMRVDPKHSVEKKPTITDCRDISANITYRINQVSMSIENERMGKAPRPGGKEKLEKLLKDKEGLLEIRRQLQAEMEKRQEERERVRLETASLEAKKKEIKTRIAELKRTALKIKIDGDCCFKVGGCRMRLVGSIKSLKEFVFEDVSPTVGTKEFLVGYTEEGKLLPIGQILSISGGKVSSAPSKPLPLEEGTGLAIREKRVEKPNPFAVLGLTREIVGSLPEEKLKVVVRSLAKVLMGSLHPDKNHKSPALFKAVSESAKSLEDPENFQKFREAYVDSLVGSGPSSAKEGVLGPINADIRQLEGRLLSLRVYRQETQTEEGKTYAKLVWDFLKKDFLPGPAYLNEDGSAFLHHCDGYEITVAMEKGNACFEIKREGTDVFAVSKSENMKLQLLGSTSMASERLSWLASYFNSEDKTPAQSMSRHLLPILSPGSSLVALKDGKLLVMGRLESIDNSKQFLGEELRARGRAVSRKMGEGLGDAGQKREIRLKQKI